MKVERLSIYRVRISLSCGCAVECDFKDPRCKESLVVTSNANDPLAERYFKICHKHEEDAERSMLEFLLSERLAEAVEEAQRPPVGPVKLVDQKGLEGETVTKVAGVSQGANRPKRPPGVKTIQRSPEQLAKAGAIPTAPAAAEEVETGDEASNVSSLDSLLDEHDPTEQKVSP